MIGAAGALAAGDDVRAAELAEATLDHAEAFGSALSGPCRVLLGRLQRRAGEPVAADRTVHAGLAVIVDAGLLVDVPDALEALGGCALDLGSLAEAARLHGAAAGLRVRLDVSGAYPTEARVDLARIEELLGAEFAAATPRASTWTPRPPSPTPDGHAVCASDPRSAGRRSPRPSWRWPGSPPRA